MDQEAEAGEAAAEQYTQVRENKAADVVFQNIGGQGWTAFDRIRDKVTESAAVQVFRAKRKND